MFARELGPTLQLHTEQAYITWIRRFILFNDKRHPAEMSAMEIERFLSHLAVEGASRHRRRTKRSPQSVLYREVLEIDLPWSTPSLRTDAGARAVVLPRSEVQRLLEELHGEFHLVAQLLYGSGLRLMETLRLRVKDIDFRILRSWSTTAKAKRTG